MCVRMTNNFELYLRYSIPNRIYRILAGILLIEVRNQWQLYNEFQFSHSKSQQNMEKKIVLHVKCMISQEKKPISSTSSPVLSYFKLTGRETAEVCTLTELRTLKFYLSVNHFLC